MADKFKTLFPVSGSFTPGEQPSSNKFTILYGLTRAGFEQIERALGAVRDATNTPSVFNLPNQVRTSKRHLLDDPATFYSGTVRYQTQMVSVARTIGAAGILNPQYLGGINHSKANQGAGWPLLQLRLQQLPFPPITGHSSGNFTFSGPDILTTYATYVLSPQLVKNPGEWHVTEDGILLSYLEPSSGVTLAYDLQTQQGDTYYNAGYNVIPDPSILRMTEVERKNATVVAGDHGCCELTFDTMSGDMAIFDLALPEVISVHESIATGDQTIDEFEPVGAWDSGTGKRRYTLSELYSSLGVQPDNTLQLWDEANSRIIEPATFEKIDAWNFKVYLPAWTASATGLINDAGATLWDSGGSNTKDFFLLAIGTQLTSIVSQLRSNSRNHEHNGIGSARIDHQNLIGNFWLRPGWGTTFLLGASSQYARVFGESGVQDNVHPQYLHRHGFRHGGTAGSYEGSDTLDIIYTSMQFQDLNMFEGDLVFCPISHVDGAGTVTAGYTWDHTGSTDPEYLSKSATHRLWFGYPGDNSNYLGAFGALSLHYEPEVEDEVDIGGAYDLSIHGLAGGDSSSGLGVSDWKRGTLLKGGHLFFGLNEQNNRGLHSNTLLGYPIQRSASWLTSEFNIVTTANKRAGQNTSSLFKSANRTRDGFTARATHGSSINLSAGGVSELGTLGAGEETDVEAIAKLGSIVLEASLGWGSTTGIISEHSTMSSVLERTDGSLFAMGPAVGLDGYLPWGDEGNSDFFGSWKMDVPLLDLNQIKRGGFAYLAALENRAAPLGAGERQNESPAGELAKPSGQLFFEGSNGINLISCLNYEYHRLASLVETGQGSNGDPTSISFNLGSDPNYQFPHSEVKVWGVPNDSELSLVRQRAAGGNINLLYKYGRNYDRFGLDLSWNDSAAGSSSVDGGGSTGVSPWSNARKLSIVDPDYNSYGSAIRQASTVDAFVGLRADPLQPYTSTYRFPIRVRKQIAIGTSVTFGSQDDMRILIPSFNSDLADATAYYIMSIEGQQQDLGSFLPLLPGMGTRVTFDSIIRWHDGNLAMMRDLEVVAPGISLTNYQVCLDRYVPVDGSGNFVGHSAAWTTMFSKVGAGTTFENVKRWSATAPVWGAGATDFDFIPVSGNQEGSAPNYSILGLVDNPARQIPYSSSLGLTEINSTASGSGSWDTYLDNMPGTQSSNYGSFTNAQWAVNLNMRLPDNAGRSTPDNEWSGFFPFRIERDGGNLYLTVSGYLEMTFITQDNGQVLTASGW